MRQSFLAGILTGLVAFVVTSMAWEAVRPRTPAPVTTDARPTGADADVAPPVVQTPVTTEPAATAPEPAEPSEAEAAVVFDVIVRAERDPALLATLDAVGHPTAAAWRAFFVHAGYGPVPPDPRGRIRELRAKALAALPRRLHDDFETFPHEEPPPALVSSLRFARDVSSVTHGEETLPCWIAARWTDAWVHAYTTRIGATDDDGLPTCTLPSPLREVHDAWEARLRAAYEALYDSAPVCSGYGAARMHLADVRLVQALYDPHGFDRDVPDVDALSREQHDDIRRAIHDVRSPRRLAPAAVERMWRTMVAPASWNRAVVAHYTRVLRLPAPEAARRARRLATYVRAAFLEAAGGCDWGTDPYVDVP